ncbi:hypothetical protein J1N35_040538 [Gossypium stocksii]|uniref:Uncharacterized protein n=1 Tax=Gossypium stocksii TaxID=47602 RepID=A0A9D3UE38_9ROSI|nr:hypothetical protein J1N35_040538 [Gossypium stocksii]
MRRIVRSKFEQLHEHWTDCRKETNRKDCLPIKRRSQDHHEEKHPMAIQEEIHTVILTHRGIRVEGKKASSMRSFKMKNEKVSKDSLDKFQLHYLPEARQFKLFSKGKIVNNLSPQLLKGKQGKGS